MDESGVAVGVGAVGVAVATGGTAEPAGVFPAGAEAVPYVKFPNDGIVFYCPYVPAANASSPWALYRFPLASWRNPSDPNVTGMLPCAVLSVPAVP